MHVNNDKRCPQTVKAYVKLSQQSCPNKVKLSQQSPNILSLLHLAISGALSGCETVNSASFYSL
jgi:hypothetical protein